MKKAMIEEVTSLGSKLTKLFGVIAIYVSAFLAPIFPVMLAVGLIIVLDTIVGIWKAKKLKYRLTSRRLSRVVMKMFIYQMCIITFYVIDWSIFDDVIKQFVNVEFALTKIMAVVLMSIEFYSIDESFNQATGKGLLQRLKSLIKNLKDVKEELPDIKKYHGVRDN